MESFVKRMLSAMALALLAVTVSAQTEQKVEFVSMTFDAVGIGGRMVRLGDNGIFLSDAGMHFEAPLTLKATGYRGRRVVCVVMPLDNDGNSYVDGKGEVMTLIPFTPSSDKFTGTLNVEVPYAWLDMENKPTTMKFAMGIINPETMEMEDPAVLTVDLTKMNIDREHVGEKLLGDVLGVGSTNSSDMLGGLIGSFFGGSDATARSLCSACDGMALCPVCYGDAFLDPSRCRRCSNDPGICRRCRGTGKESVDIDINSSSW